MKFYKAAGINFMLDPLWDSNHFWCQCFNSGLNMIEMWIKSFVRPAVGLRQILEPML